MTVTTLNPGHATCATGGIQVTRSGVNSFVCNGAVGAKGDKGDVGNVGPKGDKGDKGDTGAAGADGVGITVTGLPTGNANCSTGGVQVTRAGVNTYVCNGAQGIQGIKGDTGNAGADGIGVTVTTLPINSPNCATGGIRVDVGLDNGDGGGVARNDKLEPGEIDKTEFICTESMGFPPITRTTALGLGHAQCLFGGSQIDYGLDDGSDGGVPKNGLLEDGEIDGTTYACLPMPPGLLVKTVDLFPGDLLFAFGGK